jgi:hypothetical protein
MRLKVYAQLALEIAGVAAVASAALGLAVLLVTGRHGELLLLIVPLGACVGGWLRTPKVSRLTRSALLAAAIDQAPHRFERPRRPAHRLYGTFVEADGGTVVVALVHREPRSRGITVIERCRHRGDELEEAAESVAAVDEMAAHLERQIRDRQRKKRERAQRERIRRAQEADDARLGAIDERHARELAEREDQLRAEDEQARHSEAEREAASLAQALRREP